MERKINIACFKEGSRTVEVKDIWQWDYGQILRIQGLNLPTAVEIHFSLDEHGGEAARRIGITKDGVTDVVVPDTMLENESAYGDSYYFFAYIYLTDETSGNTEYKIRAKVSTRSKPEGYVSGGNDTFAEILKTVNEIAEDKVDVPASAKVGQVLSVKATDESGKPTEFEATDQGGGVSDEKIAEAVGTYMETHPIDETDPTVPDWAKQQDKPTYTAEEVGALPENTKIPSKTSDLQNDSGFTTLMLDDLLTDNTKAAPAGMVGELKGEIINQAEVDDDGLVSFKNSQGLTLFTLDLSEFSGGGNVYGELVISTESLSINEGESGTFTIKLASAPTTNQIVYLALSDNTKLSITPSTLTFTPSDYGAEQTVTVTALEDEDSDDETITISLTSKKVSAKSLLVSIADDDIDLVEDGLTLYYNLRNGDLTDSVGGVVATNGGTIVDGGVKLESNNTKFQFVYPVKTENIPNGATVELALTGLADLQGAGNGYGNGYAYKNIFYGSSITAGFAYTANGSIASSDFSFGAIESPNTFIDFATENHICFVYNADGSADVYFNGELFKTRNIPDGFEHYNASGNITFKIPYGGAGGYNTYPVTLSEIRIYERALTSDEVKNNYDATISHQETVNF